MARITAFTRQIEVFKNQFTGQARSDFVAEQARMARDEAKTTNHSILGRDVAVKTFVDGSQGAIENAVRPGGTIVYLFDVGAQTLSQCVDEFIELIVQFSPFKTGQYRDSNLLIVNNEERDAVREGGQVELKETDEVVLVNLLPYARKIEKGASAQAPNGVYEAAYSALLPKWRNLLKISFAWESWPGHEVGTTKTGAKPTSRKDKRRAAAFPTIRILVK